MRKCLLVMLLAMIFAGCGKTVKINESYDPARTVVMEVQDFTVTIKPLARSLKEEKIEDKTQSLVTYIGTGWEKNPVGSHKYTVFYVSIVKKTAPEKGGKIELMRPLCIKSTTEDEFEPVAKTGLSLGDGDKTMLTLKNRAEFLTFDKGPVDGLLVFPNLGLYEGEAGLILPFKYFGTEKGAKGKVFEVRANMKLNQEF